MAAKYTAEGVLTTVLTTELDGLADDGTSALSPTKSNDAVSERDLVANFELFIATQGTARTAGAFVSLFIIPEVDDVNFGDVVGDCLLNYFVGSVLLDASVNARYVILEDVKIPPSDFKIVLQNQTGQALAATGNTVKYRVYSYEDA